MVTRTALERTAEVRPAYVLLLVVKSGHVGSEWFAELVAKQSVATFKHEANACVRGVQLVSGLITGAGCPKVPVRKNISLPLLGLSFNVGAFSETAMETWAAALQATPPTVPIIVTSLTRTNDRLKMSSALFDDTPPNLPIWCLQLTSERHLRSLEACRGLRSPPQAAPKFPLFTTRHQCSEVGVVYLPSPGTRPAEPRAHSDYV